MNFLRTMGFTVVFIILTSCGNTNDNITEAIVEMSKNELSIDVTDILKDSVSGEDILYSKKSTDSKFY